MMNACLDTSDICVIRGDDFTMTVSLTERDDPDVVANPSSYVGQLVFRLDQDDGLAPYLTLTAPVTAITDALPGEPQVIMEFAATPAQTQTLPAFDHVYYCEIVTAGSASVQRLVQGKVDLHD